MNWSKLKNREVVMFVDKDGNKLYVSPKGKSVEFITPLEHNGLFLFQEHEADSLISYLISLGQRVKPDFAPKYGNSAGSDMYEYYDRTYDNNGYCSASRRPNDVYINFERSYGSENRLYLMTLPKVADLLWAIKKH